MEMPIAHYRRTVRPDGTHGATLRCHVCAKRYTLAAEHRIDVHGNVTPSVVCPHAGCSQSGAGHVGIRLLTSMSR
jgi:hypothetical protein